MSGYYSSFGAFTVKDMLQLDSGASVKLVNSTTGVEMTINSADFMSESDFLDEVFSLTGDPRFDPCSCSRAVMEKLIPVTDPSLRPLS